MVILELTSKQIYWCLETVNLPMQYGPFTRTLPQIFICSLTSAAAGMIEPMLYLIPALVQSWRNCSLQVVGSWLTVADIIEIQLLCGCRNMRTKGESKYRVPNSTSLTLSLSNGAEGSLLKPRKIYHFNLYTLCPTHISRLGTL